MKKTKRKIRRRCKCGCGGITKLGNKFIYGHQRRGKKFFIKKPLDLDAPFCKCGCFKKVTWNKQKKDWNKYIIGHNNKERMKGNQYAKGNKHTKKFRKYMSMIMSGTNNFMYGKTHTKKTCKKISEKMRGKVSPRKGCKLSEKTKGKISLAHMGKKHTEKTKNKIRTSFFKTLNEHPEIRDKLKTFKGKKHTEETKKKIQSFMIAAWADPEFRNELTGDRAAGWKGGISCEPYCDVWVDKDFKESIKQRDNYKCQNPDCWHATNIICLHHINYNKKDCHPWNLITLCNSCNSRANYNRDYWKKFYQNIMTKKYGYEYEKIKKRKLKRKTISNTMLRSSYQRRSANL